MNSRRVLFSFFLYCTYWIPGSIVALETTVLPNYPIARQTVKTLQQDQLTDFLTQHSSYSRTNLSYLKEGKVIANTTVTQFKVNQQEHQKLVAYLSGIHPKTCQEVNQIIGEYEKFKERISHIKKSDYQGTILTMRAETPKLPFVNLSIAFDFNLQIERVKESGSYPYIMDSGIFKGLTGEVKTIDLQVDPKKTTQCLYFITAFWQGKHTGYPDTAIEISTTFIAKEGLEKLFMVSGHQPTI